MVDTARLDLDRLTRELLLIHALDRVRDSLAETEEPRIMFEKIVHLLREQFSADACAILLVAETSGEIELLAVSGIADTAAQNFCQQVLELPPPTTVMDAEWGHIWGLRITLDQEPFPLGSMIIARNTQPFDAVEQALLAAVESQLDSAVIQARMVWKMAERNRELEIIYKLDRLRDEHSDEEALLNGFTDVLQTHYRASLCAILLRPFDQQDAAFVIGALYNEQLLDQQALAALSAAVVDLQIPQHIATPQGVDNLSLLAAPLFIGKSKLRVGAVVVGRPQSFTIADHRLLFAVISQIDSAIEYSRIHQQSEQRRRELETIYHIDRIRDKDTDFDEMMQHVLSELCAVINSDMGYLMLYSSKGERGLELKAMTDEDTLMTAEYRMVIDRFSREALNTGAMVASNIPSGPVQAIIAVPLILNDRIIGVFGVLNSSSGRGFSAADQRMLSAITSQVDTAVFERLERRRMRRVLGRSVDPQVLERLLQQGDDNILAGERVVISVLFADLRGSTEWAERTEPEELVSTLNEFLTMMTKLIFKYGGTLDKFVGDQVIGLFGSPVPMADHAYKIAQCALEMREEHKKLQQVMEVWGRDLPPMGIGISSGEVIAGEFGPPIRTDFTAMGRVMNLGARLCGAAGAEEIFISRATYAMISELVEVRLLDPLNLKGIHQAVEVYELLALK